MTTSSPTQLNPFSSSSASFGSSAGPSTNRSSGGGSQQPSTPSNNLSTTILSFGVTSASAKATPAFGYRKTAESAGIGSSALGVSAVSNAASAFTMPSSGDPTAAATVAASTTSAAIPFPNMFSSTAASSSSAPFSTSTTPTFSSGISSALSNTTASFTQPSSPASVPPARAKSVFSRLGTSGQLSSPAPAKPVFSRLGRGTITTMDPVLSASAAPATTTSVVTTGLLSSPAPVKPVFSRLGRAAGLASTITTMDPVLSASAAPATTTSPLSSPAPVKPVFSRLGRDTELASTITMGPVLSASTAPAAPANTTSALTTDLLSSPAPAKPVFSGCLVVTDTISNSPALGSNPSSPTTDPKGKDLSFSSLRAATSAGSTQFITTSKQEPEPLVLKVADLDFYNFDKNKSEECFAVDQKWAVFDNLDLMPRKYVQINKVYSPFKVDVTLLEFIAEDINETAWKRSGLPVACGKFKYEKTQKTDTITAMSSFSHMIFMKKNANETCSIYPRKGETWALYKNWNVKWSSDPDNHRKYEYEYVIVLSDYTKKSGVLVSHLVKLKGFVCLFKPAKNNGMASFQIPSSEMLRFSHRVPSFRTNGKERKDVPEGYFELDTCSLPSNIEEVSGVIKVEAETVDCNINGSLISLDKHPLEKKRKNPDAESTLDGSSRGGNKSSRMSNGPNEERRAAEASGQPPNKSKATSVSDSEKNATVDAKKMSPEVVNIPGSMDEGISSSPSSLKSFEMLGTELCNFDEERSCEKFKTGQIWAVYCKLDKLPKNYAQIESVESFPVFKLAVKWLKSCDPPRGIIPWVDKEMPVSCGTFKVTSSEVVFSDSISFSHQLSGIPTADNIFTILPRAGEVWALYSKFRSDLTCSDLKKCEYDIVEILEVVDVHWIIVSVLERITGFKTVFKAKETEGLDSTAAIPWIELYRFSHQVPTFMLSGARYGKLRGCWELDPRALTIC